MADDSDMTQEDFDRLLRRLVNDMQGDGLLAISGSSAMARLTAPLACL